MEQSYLEDHEKAFQMKVRYTATLTTFIIGGQTITPVLV